MGIFVVILFFFKIVFYLAIIVEQKDSTCPSWEPKPELLDLQANTLPHRH